MKNLKTTLIILALTMVMLIPTGCGSANKIESWARDYEPTEEYLALYDDGKAVLEGKDYTYVKDDDSITLTDKDGNSIEHRYYIDNEKMVFYIASVYEYQDEGEPDGIVGNWACGNNVFRFLPAPKLEFSEEDAFYGHYSVHEANSSVKLMYDAPLPDATFYYSLTGKELTIDYPWPLVKTQAKDTTKKDEGTT